MPKITFVVDYTPKGQAPDRPTYKAGETYDLEASYAEKYVRRGWAEPAAQKPARTRKQEASEEKATPPIVPPVAPAVDAAPAADAGSPAPSADLAAAGNPT